ncbi:hypothetical protein EDD11_008827 [Mortierella claussenii]|nr:hypothetical protein EDD11_008827 [Mortierella claussenii]
MHRLLNHNRPAANMNKPLPEPLVDPDEGKTPIGMGMKHEKKSVGMENGGKVKMSAPSDIVGELVIVPIQGKDLPNRERFGKQDPFILFKLGNVSKRSSTDIRGGQRPQWKDDQINIFMYESDAKDAKSLYVTCLDEDPQKNDLIGDCVINLAKVLEQGEHDDWFELSYKGREAGMLLLQLTYYSHDPKHPTNKMNRGSHTPVSSGAAARRPIHPVKKTKAEEKPAVEEHVDEGPVYTPPVVPEPPVVPQAAQVPMVPGATGYPYGTMPAGAGVPGLGRPVSPSGQGHYVGHHTPQVPPANPYAMPGANPYGAPVAGGYPGYPAPGAGPYADPNADPSKRLSFPGQPAVPPPQGGFLPGYPPAATGAPGYSPQAPGAPTFPPQSSPGYLPQIAGGVYPPSTGPGINPMANSPYPPAQPLPNGGGGPPPAYPFAASGVYPPNSNNSSNGGFPQNNNNSNNNNNNQNFPGVYPGNSNSSSTGPYGNHGGINSHSNGSVNNMNNNNNNGFNNSNNNGFNNNNNNGGNFNNNNNNNNFNNNGFNNNTNNNFNNGGNNFGNNNNNGGNNFGNQGNNFNNFNNGGSNNFNNGGNNFNNNGNNFNSGGSNHSNNSYNSSNNHGGGYPSATITRNTITPTPTAATPVTQHRPAGGAMYDPNEF